MPKYSIITYIYDAIELARASYLLNSMVTLKTSLLTTKGKAVTKQSPFSNKYSSKANKAIDDITFKILVQFRKTAEGIIEVGKNLLALKKILGREDFLSHIKSHFNLSEMQANRMINIYLKFGAVKSKNVLQAKPSVLYLLAANSDHEKIDILIKGGKIDVDSEKKTIDELSVKDATKIHKGASVRKKSIYEPHRDLATICESLVDWTKEFKKRKPKLEATVVKLLKINILETQECLAQIKSSLRA